MSNKKHLRWKKKPSPTGLAAVCSGPVGSILHDGELRYATVDKLRKSGWYWVAGWDSSIPYKNTCNEPCETQDEAKAQAKNYVKEKLEIMQSEDNSK